jgi:hypothetical protein
VAMGLSSISAEEYIAEVTIEKGWRSSACRRGGSFANNRAHWRMACRMVPYLFNQM